MGTAEPAYKDPWLWGAIGVAFLLRMLPMLIWGENGCMRDECAYVGLATGIVDGQGLQPAQRWLWAPLYPYLLAGWSTVANIASFKRVQVVLSLGNLALLYAIGHRVEGRRVARIAAWVFALHPTLIYFSGRLWTEAVFLFLLTAAIALIPWVRDGRPWRGAALGATLAACALTRGMGVYLAPMFLVALVWPTNDWPDGLRRYGKHAAITLAATLLAIAPYSYSASTTHGGFIISDVTLGEVAYNGNNDFPAPTWDLGNGLVGTETLQRVLSSGRERCDSSLSVVDAKDCEVERAKEWVLAHPAEFARRIPLRWAQLLNPNSFLTRHIRIGLWRGLPHWVRDLIALSVIFTSVLLTFGGTLGLIGRGKGALSMVSVGLALYVFAVVGCLFGVSRFRLPLVPLWIVWTAVFLAAPRATLQTIRGSKWRLTLAIAAIIGLVPLVSWFLLAGFPAWYR
ncbi:MAG: 4-amino-4-deoxy-L-arabinose transferase-like glycosyltransferase [Myxococcota bacterium]